MSRQSLPKDGDTVYAVLGESLIVGIVLDTSERTVVLGHSFKGIVPTDRTEINTSDIQLIEKIHPHEINTEEDISLFALKKQKTV